MKDKCKGRKGGRKRKIFIGLILLSYLIAFAGGVAVASLSSVQTILNDVWSDSDNALQVTISL